MKKLIFLVTLALGFATSMRAQEAVITMEDDAALKKGINEMKLNEGTVYAEVIELVTDDNEAVSLAQQKSIALLQTHVIEIFSKRMNMKAEDVREIWDVIDDKCQNITVKKGDLMRVFTYITRDALGLGPKKPDPEEVKKIFGDENTKSVVVNIDPEAKKEEEVTPLPPTPPVDDSTKVDTPLPPTSSDSTKVDTPTPPTPPVVDTPKPEPEVKVTPNETPALCKTMIAKKTYSKLMSYLKAEKSQQKLMFGNYDTMQYPSKCYVAVVDTATRAIVAVLDKGQTDRMNFVTQKMDRYENYKGGDYAVIFVQEY